jgi:hypothetical protein
MVTLADRAPNLLDHVGELREFMGVKHSEDRRFIGITVFQIAIMDLLDEGSRQWTAFLQSVGAGLHEEVCEIYSVIPNVF